MKKTYLFRLIIAGIVGIMTILAIYGIYPIKIMDLQFASALQRLIFDFSRSVFSIVAIILVLTLLFGRLYCSMICPFGILQEFCALLFKKSTEFQKNLPVKYYIAALSFGMMLGGSALLIRHIDPYTVFGSAVSLTLFGLIFTIAVLVLVFFKNRYFCTNICPVGAVLGLISKLSFNKIYIDNEKCVSCGLCAKVCSSGCINHKEKQVDNETCVKCLKCLKECKKDAINFGRCSVKFNPKRRDFMIASTALILFGGAIKAGIEITKNLAKKIKDVILPPGAENADRMLNKCLNCNLCIQNCPNKILTKANEKFSAVHIDYSKGERFCKYDCNMCSNVCPSGAIKRIKLGEKQKTRIAMAFFNKEICNHCGLCSSVCPTGAILLDEKKEPFLDASKCIGCGKCAKMCQFGAIEIFGINEQRRI